MKNVKKFLAIMLALVGVVAFSSCKKSCTCKLENGYGTINIDNVQGKCSDIQGEWESSYDGYSFDIRSCR